ncbi:MAG: TusE/DsrC/DsvC family sulfur relay protein [Myxococcaceae bacterium]
MDPRFVASISTNDEGYLTDPSLWTPELAEQLAREAGLALTEAHWKVLAACREDAAQQGGLAPDLKRISRLTRVSLPELYRLFPRGPEKLAARIAGLPKPRARQ